MPNTDSQIHKYPDAINLSRVQKKVYIKAYTGPNSKFPVNITNLLNEMLAAVYCQGIICH